MSDPKTLEKALDPLLRQEAYELVDLQYRRESRGWVLRVFLDKAGGVSVDDCAYMSDRIGPWIEENDLIPHAYTLEVSSPGVDRVLKKASDFARFEGHRAKLRLRAPDAAGRRNFRGLLSGVGEGRVRVDLSGETARLPLEAIEEARLDPDLEI